MHTSTMVHKFASVFQTIRSGRLCSTLLGSLTGVFHHISFPFIWATVGSASVCFSFLFHYCFRLLLLLDRVYGVDTCYLTLTSMKIGRGRDLLYDACRDGMICQCFFSLTDLSLFVSVQPLC